MIFFLQDNVMIDKQRASNIIHNSTAATSHCSDSKPRFLGPTSQLKVKPTTGQNNQSPHPTDFPEAAWAPHARG